MAKKALFILLLCPTLIFAAAEKAAKAIIVRGSVEATVDGKTIKIKRGEWLPEGAEVKTAKKSFTKLLFKDKSTMNVGPESQMKIDSFPEKDAGIITLVKGTIRSKVTKNYMQIKDKDKSKLFIKTKTAAMGVRGTDFQVAFNPVNLNTSLITFEGAVAMAKLSALAGRVSQRALEAVVSSPDAVMVMRGQFSGATPNTKKATLPVKISPVQLESLDKNDTLGAESAGETSSNDSKGPKKSFRSVVPPGMDSKLVANDSSSVDSVMSDTVGGDTVKAVETSVAAETATAQTAPPEGSINMKTGQIAPTAGGFVDIKTAQYIPPPPGSTFDANAGVYVPPPEMGGIDPTTGNYTNDHFVLNEDGSFSEKPKEVASNSPTPGTRAPASADSGAKSESAPPPPPTVTMVPTMMDNINPEMMDSVMEGDVPPPPSFGSSGDGSAPELDPNLASLVDEQMSENNETFEDFNNSDNNLIFGGTQRSNVNFNVNVE